MPLQQLRHTYCYRFTDDTYNSASITKASCQLGYLCENTCSILPCSAKLDRTGVVVTLLYARIICRMPTLQVDRHATRNRLLAGPDVVHE